MGRSTSSSGSNEGLSVLIENIQNLIKQFQAHNFFSEDLNSIFNRSSMDNAYHLKMINEIWMPMSLEYSSLFNQVMLSSFLSSTDKLIQVEKDTRFSGELWQMHPIFNFLSQSHLIMEKYAKKFILLNAEYVKDQKSVHKLSYLMDQIMGALSPSNFILTNPILLQELILTNGESLIKGLDNFRKDLLQNPEHLQIPMVDRKKYHLGENIAVTPGKVIFQNELIQLIQYEAQTKTVYERPLLFVSAIINKFYILDLNAESSLIDWMVKKGYTVFSLSWVNPDASFSSKTFSDYVLDGPVAAIEVIKKVTGIPTVNIAGYCIGGTLVACALAYLSARNDHSVKSVTYLTTMLDFQDFGFFTDFVDKDYVKKIDNIMKEQGYLDGYFLHQLFNFLRPKDLVWPYYIKNYLQGESPGENDLLFWNSDYANLPPKVIDYCLNNFVINNELIKPKHLFIDKTPIDLSSIKIPAYFFSTIRDHLTPWKSTYAGLRTHSGDCVFILGDSGHIAGVVNPPTKKKYGYFINVGAHNTPDEFLEKAKKISGSWWPHWEKWLKPQSGKKIKARQPGSDQYPIIEDAPGSYVKVQYLAPKTKMASSKKPKR